MPRQATPLCPSGISPSRGESGASSTKLIHHTSPLRYPAPIAPGGTSDGHQLDGGRGGGLSGERW